MSSTGRSIIRFDHPEDYYVTPIYSIEVFLQEFDKRVKLDWNHVRILDPCAGGNSEIKNEYGVIVAKHSMSYPTAICNVFDECDIASIDVRKDSLAELKMDYLKWDLKFYSPKIIITNPPFNLALPIIKKALYEVADDGYVIMLLRLDFFGSKARKPFFDENMPEWCFIHHQRMSFFDKKDSYRYVVMNEYGYPKGGGTDSSEYAHFVFHKGVKPEYTKTVII